MDAVCIKRGLAELAEVDGDLATAIERVGLPEPRIRPQGFETFLRTIVGQQISAKVAEVIMSRVAELLPEMSAAALLELSEASLRKAGLSYRKISYARGVAEQVVSGEFDIAGLNSLDDETAIEQIIQLRGFGRWSAEIYLMFSLQRQDVFPADDLAIRVALGRLKGLDDKPTAAQARELTRHWTPWRSVGSLFLWHYYRGAPA